MWRHLRVTSGLYKVQTSMYTIVYNLLSVDAVFLFQVRVKARLNIVNDRLPAESWIVSERTLSFKRLKEVEKDNHLSSLLTKSPNPGVSTTVKRRRTPFSSMSEVIPISNYDFICREKELHTSTDAFNWNGLRPLRRRGKNFFLRIEGSIKQSVDERRLSQSRFAWRAG